MWLAFGALIALAGSFVVGARYGHAAESTVLAEYLKAKAVVDADYKNVVAKIKADAATAISSIKKHL